MINNFMIFINIVYIDRKTDIERETEREIERETERQKHTLPDRQANQSQVILKFKVYKIKYYSGGKIVTYFKCCAKNEGGRTGC